jgi:ubiquinol-cytochrome c reductase cytochrome b subunit
VSIANSVGVDLPRPLNIRFSWNFGSLLLFFLGGQIVTGILLATNYVAGIDLAFQMIDSLGRDVW